MSMRTRIKGLAIGRIAFGAAMLVMPEPAVGGWIGRRAASYGGTQTVTRGFGARDLVLGAGALAALGAGRDARDWVAAGALCDVADFVATLTADDIPAAGRALVLGLAGTAIAVSAAYLAGGEASASEGS
jgi:hypothetical protein